MEAAIRQVELIEQEPDEDGEVNDFLIQVWVGDRLLKTRDGFPEIRPTQNEFGDTEHNDETWIRSAVVNADEDVAIVLWSDSSTAASLSSTDVFFLFTPLFFSLPILLLPAWFMTRFGLRPLGDVVTEISERVDSGELSSLSQTRYRELNPIIDAVNRLMKRLDGQLKRERGFVADVAHELKTPMAIMQSNVGIINTSVDEERKATAVNDLSAGIDRGNHLISQLLRMARMEQGSDSQVIKRDIDLAEFLRERVIQAEPLASSRSISLEVNAPASCNLNLDADAVAAVIDNLLDNAIKYSPATGAVTVSLDCESVAGRVVLRFMDQGEGISADSRDRVFSRFERLADGGVNEDIQGAGLGLSIVTQALTRLEGSITLDAGDNGRGLAAVVTLPAKQGQAG